MKGGGGEGGDRGRYITRTSCVTAAVTGWSGGCESAEIPGGRARWQGHLGCIPFGADHEEEEGEERRGEERKGRARRREEREGEEGKAKETGGRGMGEGG